MKRRVDIDLMRIIACYAVIYHHSIAYEYFITSNITGLRYWIHMIASVFCCYGVPLFFSISGALLLDRKEEPLNKIFRRFLRIAVILLLFSFFFYLDYIKRNDVIFSFKDFLYGLYANDWNYAYWFLYAYMLFILLMPFNQILCRSLKYRNIYAIYLVCLTFFYMALLPIINFFLGHELYNSLIIPDAIIYSCMIPLIGNWFYHTYEGTGRRIIFWLCLSILGLGITCWVTYLKQGEDVRTPQDFFMSMTVVYSICLMLFIKKCVIIRSEKILSLIGIIGKSTFGVYLIHVFFVTNYQLDNSIYYWMVDHNMPHFISGGCQQLL